MGSDGEWLERARAVIRSDAAAILATPFLIHMASRHPAIQVKLARGSIELLCQALRLCLLDGCQSVGLKKAV